MISSLSRLSELLEVSRLTRIAVCLVLLTFVSGIIGCTRATTQVPEPPVKIVGLWEDSDQAWIFHPDGTFRIDERDGGSGSSGTWVVESQILKLHFGFGSTGQDLDIPIQFSDNPSSLIFNGERKLSRNIEAQKQYNEVSGRLNLLPSANGG